MLARNKNILLSFSVLCYEPTGCSQNKKIDSGNFHHSVEPVPSW